MAKIITPLFARIVVEPKTAEEVRASGIVLPDTISKDKPEEGTVISIGPDCKAVTVGNVVLFKKYSPTEVKIEGKTFFLIDEEDVLGTLS